MDAEDEGLECNPSLLLYAFELAGPYATGKSNTAKLENRQQLALALVDWALMECDRGVKLLELTAEMAIRKPGDGTIVIGPYGI